MAPLEFLPEPVVHSLPAFAPICASFLGFRPSQWSTRRSGPLAPGFCPVLLPFPWFPAELVVHSAEWTTGSWRLPCLGLFYLVS